MHFKNEVPAISVIVAVYNKETQIQKCLKSLKNQSFTNFEALLIDDGSTDKSALICERYTIEDPRFKYLYKENDGVSSTRQFGLELAQGTYIIHCDPDDWVDKFYLEKLYKKAIEDDSDMVICDFYSVTNSSIKITRQCPSGLLASDVRKDLMQILHGACWNKLIKSTCAHHTNVSFPKGINICEDMIYILQVLDYCEKISYISEPLYYYQLYDTDESITKTISKDRNSQYRKAFQLILKQTEHYGEEYQRLVYQRFLYKIIKDTIHCQEISITNIYRITSSFRKYIKYGKYKTIIHFICTYCCCTILVIPILLISRRTFLKKI